MNILLVAEEAAGINVLRALEKSEHSIVATLTTEQPSGRGQTVAGAAEALGVPVLPADRVRDGSLADWVHGNHVDLLLNVHSLHVIHADVIESPRIGSFNLHPGPLPEYAGLNAPSWAIFRGEARHAVTVHWMAAAIDTGAIAYASSFDIDESDTGLSVATRCGREGVALVLRLVEVASTDPSAIPRIEQDLARRRYFGREVPNGGRIVWSQSAQEIANFVRACDYRPFPSPWGHPRGVLRGRPIEVLTVSRTGIRSEERPGTVGDVHDGGALIATADEWVLVERVRIDGEGANAGDVLVPGDLLADGR